MISVLFFTLLVSVLIFFYMRYATKRRNKRTAEIDSVRDDHESYERIRTRRALRDRNSGYQTYVTKYNSTEDYREVDK